MKRIKIYYVLRAVFSALAGAAAGVLVLWADAYSVEVFDVLLVAMGLLAVTFNLPALALSLRAALKKKRWEWWNVLLSAVSVGFGICFALIRRTDPILPALLLSYIVLLPIFRIALASEKGRQLRLELSKIAFGALLLAVTVTKREDTMFLLLGGGLIAISALYLLYALWRMPKSCRSYTEKFE
jgi:hypothetical protein